MKIYHNPHTNPYFNLAAEEYLLDNTDGEIFMLWRNEPAVIIGRYQNAYAELNAAFIREQGIKVVRRLTGGGAVFHDLGNVNFTYIAPRGNAEALDFDRFTRPVIAALRKLGVQAELSGRNDIVVAANGETRKISGNAQCVRSASYMKGEKTDKILHHGTLLYSADMSRLVGALNVDTDKIRSKGIKSVRSRVANIKEYLSEQYSGMDAAEFMDFLQNEFAGESVCFTETEIGAIQNSADNKYASWNYTYGESKRFSTVKKKYFEFGTVEIGLDADGGVISDISICGDFFGVRDTEELCGLLRGKRLEYAVLVDALRGVSEYIMGAAPAELAELLT